MTHLIPLGNAFIPDPTSIEYLVKINRAILNLSSSEFILQNENILLPHVSLFQRQFEKTHLDTLKRILDNNRTLIKSPIILKSKGLNLWGNKICFIDLVVNEELSLLQQDFILKMDPLRDRRRLTFILPS